MKAIDILRGINSHQHSLRVNLRWQGQLDQDAVDFISAIQVRNDFEKRFG